ncbi:MAG: DHA2 family efflux MFS transporter permease subunit [Candidatus Dormiibacterota bacterium]
MIELVLVFGFFMILLDTTIVNIAIPSIIDGLKASLDQILWVINGYILVYAVLLITAGRLGDYFGQRNVFAIGLVIFIAASAACGLAQDPSQLIAFRVIQGVGGALMAPQTLAIITQIFPPQQRGAAYGVWGAVGGIASVAGPTLGGFLVTDYSWRAIFYLNVPIGIAVLLATFIIVPDLRQGVRHQWDLLGVLLASAGIFAISYGLIEGQPKNWGAVFGPVTIWELIAAGVVLLVLFVVWERFQKEPLLPLSLFTSSRNFSAANFVAAAMQFGMLGLFLPFVIYLQSVLGMTALQAGLTIVPMALVSMVTAPNAGRLADRIGGKYILMTGLVLLAAGMGLIIAVAGVDSHWYTFLPAVIVAGLGMGMVYAPMTQVAMQNVRPQLAGAASGMLSTSQQMGAVIGSAAVGALLQSSLASNLKTEAINRAVALPQQFRQQFINGFSNAASGGLQVGAGQTGAATHLPPGVPAQVIQLLQSISHDVFVNAFLDALKSTLYLPIGVLLVGALATLMIRRHAATAAAAWGEAGATTDPAGATTDPAGAWPVA